MSKSGAAAWPGTRNFRAVLAMVRKSSLVVIVLGLAQSIVELAGLGFGVAALFSGRNSDSVRAWAGAAIAVLFMLLAAALKRFSDTYTLGLATRLERLLREQLVTSLTRTSWHAVSRLPQGEIVAAMMSYPSMIAAGAIAWLTQAAALLAGTPLLVFALLTDWRAVALLGCIGLVSLGITRRHVGSAVGVEQHAREQAAVISEQASSVLGNLKTVFASGERAAFRSELLRTVAAIEQIRRAQIAFAPKNRFAIDISSSLGIGALLAWSVATHAEPQSTMLLFALIMRLTPRIQVLLQARLSARTQLVWLDRWDATMTLLQAETQQNGTDGAHGHHRVRIRGLLVQLPSRSFSLTADGLSIDPGDFISVRGASGSGKTTLIDALVGVVEASFDELQVDGEVWAEWNPHELWRIAYVNQAGGLTVGTVYQILVGNGNPRDAEISAALKAVELDDFVASLEDGLETQVTSLWSDLSGGQRQRLALARALLKKPDLLIIDEGMSGLELDLEERILAALQARCSIDGLTVIEVSHRIRSMERANTFWTIRDGVISAVDSA